MSHIDKAKIAPSMLTEAVLWLNGLTPSLSALFPIVGLDAS